MSESKAYCTKISIVIPIYNMQAYLKRCLDSVLQQTFADFEVICVDDGSEDISFEILEEYKKLDSRIKPYHIPHRGVSHARNYGLSKIGGEWFAFVDADDWIEQDYLDVLYNNAVKYDCALSVCGFQREKKEMSICAQNTETDYETIIFQSNMECIRSVICPGDSMEGMVWNKLYRTDVFMDIHFETNIQINEDCLYTYEVVKRCGKACFTTVPLYHWFFREDSASHSKIAINSLQAARVFLKLYEETKLLADRDVSLVLKKRFFLAVLKASMYAEGKENGDEIRVSKEQCKLWRKDVWHALNCKEKMKYIVVMYAPWVFKKYCWR